MKDLLKRYDDAKEELSKGARCLYIAVDASVADDIKRRIDAEHAIVAELIEKLAFWKRRADTRQPVDPRDNPLPTSGGPMTREDRLDEIFKQYHHPLKPSILFLKNAVLALFREQETEIARLTKKSNARELQHNEWMLRTTANFSTTKDVLNAEIARLKADAPGYDREAAGKAILDLQAALIDPSVLNIDRVPRAFAVIRDNLFRNDISQEVTDGPEDPSGSDPEPVCDEGRTGASACDSSDGAVESDAVGAGGDE